MISRRSIAAQVCPLTFARNRDARSAARPRAGENNGTHGKTAAQQACRRQNNVARRSLAHFRPVNEITKLIFPSLLAVLLTVSTAYFLLT